MKFTLLCFCMENFWNFKFSFLCRHIRKHFFGHEFRFKIFEKGGRLIQRVLLKTQLFGLKTKVGLYTESAYTLGFTVGHVTKDSAEFESL